MATENSGLATQRAGLPVKFEDLRKFVLVGRDKLAAVKAEIHAIDKLEIATGVKEQKREEAVWLAGALLDAELRMGELLPKIERLGSTRGTKWLPTGITKKQSHYFQTLAANPEIVEQVKADAFQEDDLPTRSEVLRRVKERQREAERANLKTPPFPEGKYSVLLADPPWQFDNAGLPESAESHYPTMPTDDISNLPIPTLCTQGTVLFLWATNAMLEDALQVCNAWGFNYKSNIVWIKPAGPSMGWFVKSRHELLLICTRQDNPHPKEKPTSWFEAPTSKHSRKPDLIYSMIEEMYPGPYLELFARETKKGWSSYGNEIVIP